MKDDELLERYNDIWKKIEHIIKTQFDLLATKMLKNDSVPV